MPSQATDRLHGINTSVAVKAPVQAATTANITLSGEQTIDGVAVVDGDRVLVKSQTDTSENGIYDVSTGAWSRSADFDGTRDVVQGTTVKVNAGTINAAQWFNVTTADPEPGEAMAFSQTYAALTVVSTSSETASGTIEIATQAETNAGADDSRAVTPLKLVTYVVAYVAAQIAAALAAAKSVTGRWTFTDTKSVVQTLTDGATINWDLSAGNVAKVTLGGNRAIAAPTNIQEGGFYFLSLIQDATGSRTVTWNAVFKFGTPGTPTLTTTASRTDVFTFYSPDGTNLYCVGKTLGFT